jgi:CubicO group peptidase (beta-lactamase class C family)
VIGRRALIAGGAAILVGCYANEKGEKPPAYAVTPDAELDQRFAERVRAACVKAPDAGVAVGVIAPGVVRALGFGRTAYHDPKKPTADSVFDLGTLTKTLTGRLLAVLVARGRVTLETKAETKTLGELAAMGSGKDAESNAAFAELGRVLAAHEGRAFGYLMEEQVLGPLGMTSTATFERSGALEPRLVEGRDAAGRRLRPGFSLDPNAGAWGLRTTTNDLLRYAQALLGANDEKYYGWHLDRARGLAWKDGALTGFRSAMLLEAGAGRAITLLVADARVDTLALADALLHAVPPALSVNG